VGVTLAGTPWAHRCRTPGVTSCDSSITSKLGILFVSVKYVLVSVKLVCIYVKLLKI
jgi:hypothetical protein